jgi:flagellar basal-body rod protein FlgG
MLEGLYSAAAGMAAQQKRLDAVSNDLANVNTAGYKQLRVGFHDLLYQDTGRGTAAGINVGAGAAAVDAGRKMTQGVLRRTDTPTDVAIQGSGFFRVRDANGQLALTRDGSFHVTAQGELVTSRGYRLEPRVTVPAGTNDQDISIGRDGTLSVNNRTIARLQVVDVRSPAGLESAGDNLYRPTATSGQPAPARDATVEQGVLEASNVEISDAMVDMMDAQRSFQLASRAIHMQDQMAEIANRIKG